VSLDFSSKGVVFADAYTDTVADMVGDPSTKASLKHLRSVEVLGDDAEPPRTLSKNTLIEMGKVSPIHINKNGFDTGTTTGG